MNDFKNLKKLFCSEIDEVQVLCANFLTKHNYKVKHTIDYIYAEGNIPLMLVAHMDTVLPSPPSPSSIFYDQVKQVVWSPFGLGADDRAGVYAIMKLVDWCPGNLRPHVLFTTGEETGGIGAEFFSLEDPLDLKYIIELDRSGIDDCVFYGCDNPDFTDYVSSFGFVEDWGIFSDISIICPSWKIAGVNLSIGYDFEHSTREMLCIGAMNETIDKVKRMIQDINNAQYFIYVFGKFGPDWEICDTCKSLHSISEMTIIQKGKSGNIGSYAYMCPECVAKYAKWCTCCGTGYIDASNNSRCFLCR